MLNFLLHLVEEQTVETTQVQYTLFEIIFWYSAFAITVLVAIFLLTHRKSNRKKMEALVNKVNNEIKAYENFLVKTDNQKNRFKDLTSKTILVLASFDNVFIELKEKTRLNDFDNLIKKQEEIIASIRKLDLKKSKNAGQDIEKIKNLLIEFKNEMEIVKSYLK